MSANEAASDEADSHRAWEVLLLLLSGRRLDAFTREGRLLRCVLAGLAGEPSMPASAGVFALLLRRGWLARQASRQSEAVTKMDSGCQVSSYRLSLRGWYAVRRRHPTLPQLAASPLASRAARCGRKDRRENDKEPLA